MTMVQLKVVSSLLLLLSATWPSTGFSPLPLRYWMRSINFPPARSASLMYLVFLSSLGLFMVRKSWWQVAQQPFRLDPSTVPPPSNIMVNLTSFLGSSFLSPFCGGTHSNLK